MVEILLTGSSGFIGSRLKVHLTDHGFQVITLSRQDKDEKQPTQPYWNPEKNIINLKGFDPDIVIHLASENLSDSKWDTAKKQRIAYSRVQASQLLASELAKLTPNKPRKIIASSGVSLYATNSTKSLDEQATVGDRFLAKITKQREDAINVLKDKGFGVTHLRLGTVYDTSGGVFKMLLQQTKKGLGGKFGNGKQYISWISLDDVINIIDFIIVNNLEGGINLVTPNPIKNKDFFKLLGKRLHKKTLFKKPAFLLRKLKGGMADEFLLRSVNIEPKVLVQQGYHFKHSTFTDFLDDVLL